MDTVNNCCKTFLAVFDGEYGWYSETLAIVVFVLICNFLAKWVLNRLQLSYEKQNKIWMNSFVKALYKPLSYYVWFFALVHLFNFIFARVQERIIPSTIYMILSIGAVVAITWFLMRWKNNVVQHMILKSKNREITLDQGKIDAINKILTMAILFLAALTMLEATHSNVNTLIAFSGVGGLALAFASQEIVANFFGGFMIYLNQSFTVGDWIQLPEKNLEGTVEEIGCYMTCIRSPDKRPIYIPNSMFTKLAVITPSRMSHRRILETIGLRPKDMPKLKAVISDIKEMLMHHPDLDHEQPILAHLAGFTQSSLDINLVMYSPTTDLINHMRIKEDILFKITFIVMKHEAKLASWVVPTQKVSVVDSDNLV